MVRSRGSLPFKSFTQARDTPGKGRRLRSWDQIPPWQQDNEYIFSGYRQATGSFKECLESLGYIHNETVNIYSHVIGASIFLIASIYTYRTLNLRYSKATQADILVFSTFFYGVAICFMLSATYHIITNHSPKIQKIGSQLDYLGIVILMWGSTIPSIYYGFYCDPQLQKIYWTNVSMLAILCVIATLHPKFRHPTIRPYRAAMYAGLGLSAIVFVIHGILLHGWVAQNRRMSLDWMVLMALFNPAGAVIYTARIPEKLRPLKFDVYGNSHQFLHVAVIFAGLAHMLGLFRAFDYLHTHDSVCSS